MKSFSAFVKINIKIAPVVAGLLVLAAGCATKPTGKKDFLFFPPPPDEPRIQYLTSFGSEDDLGGRSKFTEFVVGADKQHRPIWKPYGITTGKGMVYVCDTEPRNVCMIDLVKNRINYHKPHDDSAMQMPIGIVVDKDGTKYITDINRRQVMIYGAKGNPLGQIGNKGEMRPCGIALNGDKLYVTDLSNRCVRVYNKTSRELLFTVPRKPPGDEKELLFAPTNVAVDQQGKIYVSDTGGYAVKIFDAEGKHLRTIGDLGLKPGRFALPKGVGVDRAGRVYVIDAATAVAQMFDAEGRLLMYFGEPQSSGPGAMYLPAALAVDYENIDLFQKYAAPGNKIEFLIFVTNQAGPNKVSVYGFLKKG